MAFGLLMPACSDSEDDAPSPYNSPDTYIIFNTPDITWSATEGSFASPGRSIIDNQVSSFRVWGYCRANKFGASNEIDEGSAEDDWNDKSVFFTTGPDIDNLKGTAANGSDGALVTVNPGFTSYNGGTFAKWNASATASHSFIAATAASGTASFSMSAGNIASSLGPRLTASFRTASTDLNAPLDHNDQPDMLVAYKFDHRSRGAVSLQLRHLMTGIRFKFNNYSDQTLRIVGVTYAGRFYRTVTYDFKTDVPAVTVNTADTYAGTFTLYDNEATGLVIPADQSMYMGGDDNPTTLMLLPNPSGTTADDGRYVLGTDKLITIRYYLGDDPDLRTFTLGEEKELLLKYKPVANTVHTTYFNFVGDGFVMVGQSDLQWEDGNPGTNANITIK